ncbi:MAG: error-prone DNA polymerase [Alphaproteobacteria bacterium]
MTAYAELQIATNFSFLRGASHASELVERAKALGLEAIAVTDRASMAGMVRAHIAAKASGLRLVAGCRLDPQDGPPLLCWPRDREAYGRLCRLLTLGQMRAEKGQCELFLDDIYALAEGQIFAAVPPEAGPDAAFEAQLTEIARALPVPPCLVANHLYRGDDRARLARLAHTARRCGTPLIATNDVHYHAPERRPLQDVLTCIREGCTIYEAGRRLNANAERHLKSGAEMARLFGGHEDALGRTLEIVRACTFSLDELKYEYPEEPAPPGRTPQEYLEEVTWQGAKERYPHGLPDKVRKSLEHELELIARLDYAPYFLTVLDIVSFARERGILCQGRGSAANSAVCFCLGITAVDPNEIDLLFERFVSAERNEPPDIDVDFEHERREEVIQYIYERYGRDRAGIAATVICYRARSAIRDVGKAMGLTEDVTGALSGTVWGGHGGIEEKRVREAGLDPADAHLRRTLELAHELMGFPRHLSQHVGGFVLTRRPLSEVVPIGNAAMEDRTFVEWDKDDLDALGILKVDVLGLGMLTCIRKGFELLERHYGRRLTLATVPGEDPSVYDMLCKADSLGVFQVESRAQMNMLPRLRPRNFYDLVIEVAIIRPGPIQGDMVHPYLRRRNGEEKIDFPSPAPEHGPPDELKRILHKTMGVPLFQEQAMRIAIDAAQFTPDEANRLRHAMATFRRRGTIDRMRGMFIERMVKRGYERDFATRCFDQIEGFGEYGFPESHSASFAKLVYVSSWLKCHYPEVFACGLLNAQPMGFYAPAQIVRDAREHGVEVRPVDVNRSEWDCTLEDREKGRPALRLGMRQIDGMSETDAALIALARHRDFTSLRDLRAQANVSDAVLERLAAADAFRSMGLDRRQALWEIRALKAEAPLPLFEHAQVTGSGGRQFPASPPGEVGPAPAGPGEGRAPSGAQETPAVQTEEEFLSAPHPPTGAARARGPLPLPGGEGLPPPPNHSPGHSHEPGSAETADESGAALPVMGLSEHVAVDYQTMRLSLKAHPVSFLRENLARRGVVPTETAAQARDGEALSVAGVVLVRQRPGTAKGVVFITLEDETGIVNVIVWPKTLERYRRIVMGARLIFVRGRIQRADDIVHLLADELEDRSPLLLALTEEDHFRAAPARADEVKRGGPGGSRAQARRHPRNVRIIPKSRDFR